MTVDKTEKNITPKQRRAIESLLTSGSIDEAAKTTGVARDTLYRWMKDETFIAELRQAESEAIASLSRTLAGLGDKAAAAFKDGLAEHQPITIRLRAAEQITSNLLRLRELVDIESRLTALEKNYENSNEGGTA